jgi:hypothetical protein
LRHNLLSDKAVLFLHELLAHIRTGLCFDARSVDEVCVAQDVKLVILNTHKKTLECQIANNKHLQNYKKARHLLLAPDLCHFVPSSFPAEPFIVKRLSISPDKDWLPVLIRPVALGHAKHFHVS